MRILGSSSPAKISGSEKATANLGSYLCVKVNSCTWAAIKFQFGEFFLILLGVPISPFAVGLNIFPISTYPKQLRTPRGSRRLGEYLPTPKKRRDTKGTQPGIHPGDSKAGGGPRRSRTRQAGRGVGPLSKRSPDVWMVLLKGHLQRAPFCHRPQF